MREHQSPFRSTGVPAQDGNSDQKIFFQRTYQTRNFNKQEYLADLGQDSNKLKCTFRSKVTKFKEMIHHARDNHIQESPKTNQQSAKSAKIPKAVTK